MPGDGGVGPREHRSPGLCQYCAALRPAAACQHTVFTTCSKDAARVAGGASVTAAPPRAAAGRTETGDSTASERAGSGVPWRSSWPGRAPDQGAQFLGERYDEVTIG